MLIKFYLVCLFTLVTVATAALPKVGGNTGGLIQPHQQPVQSFFGNHNNNNLGTGSVRTGGFDALKIMVGGDPNKNILTTPIITQPTFGQPFKSDASDRLGLPKPVNVFTEGYDSMKQAEKMSKESKKMEATLKDIASRFATPNNNFPPPNNNLVIDFEPKPTVPMVPNTKPILLEDQQPVVIPTMADTEPILLENQQPVVVFQQEDQQHCPTCALKGAFYGAKHVLEHPSGLEEPAGLINKGVAKAFRVGEVMGAAIAGAYYGGQGIDVETQLNDK